MEDYLENRRFRIIYYQESLWSFVDLKKKKSKKKKCEDKGRKKLSPENIG